MRGRDRRLLGWTCMLAPLCGLAACNRAPSPAPQPQAASAGAAAAAPALFAPVPPVQAGLHLAYVHDIGLQVAAGALAAHFAAARDKCLGTPALHCLLLHAGLETPSPRAFGGNGRPSASLRLRLPHDQVLGFETALTTPLPGEPAGAVQVVLQSVSAEDLGRPIQDTAQRLAQLTDYLASLKSLGSRLTISVNDLVKIASETAQAQTQIEEAQAQARDLALRVDTEELDIAFTAQPAAVREVDPVTEVWAGAEASLRANAADALRFAIAALPWVPVALVGLVALWMVRRVVFGRKARQSVLS